MTPVIFFVDDEPHNLVVFEAALPDGWKVHTYDNPVTALQALDTYSPSLIVSDQRMPGMTGVQFLELAKKIKPEAIRIMVTGYSDEDLVVESVRRAQIFDYIKKPWEVDELVAALTRAFEVFTTNDQVRELQRELMERNTRLVGLMKDLDHSKRLESELRAELECWVPQFVLRALRERSLKFPLVRDLVGITFDIVKSSRFHGVIVKGRSIRSQVIQMFSEAIIRHGGWRESSSGDSAYGHFGLFQDSENPADAALAAAREFRVGLRNLARIHSIDIECGIALHTAKNCTVDIHTVQLQTSHGTVVQKSFDTTCSDIDLLHRMEKLVHQLPGSNIVMSKGFLNALRNPLENITPAGNHPFSGQPEAVDLYLIVSDQVSKDQLNRFIAAAGAAIDGRETGAQGKIAN